MRLLAWVSALVFFQYIDTDGWVAERTFSGISTLSSTGN